MICDECIFLVKFLGVYVMCSFRFFQKKQRAPSVFLYIELMLA